MQDNEKCKQIDLHSEWT